jgi:predicted acyltransferase
LTGRLAQQIGVAFALAAFAVCVLSGLVNGVEASTLLVRSVVVLMAASAMGRVLGHFAQVAVEEHLQRVVSTNPVPEPLPTPPVERGGAIEVDPIEDVDSR